MEGSAQDGEINTNDWFEFLDDYGTSDPAADFTYDGVVNTNDYFAFLAVYGAGTIGADSLTFGYDDPGGASRAGYAGYRHELAFVGRGESPRRSGNDPDGIRTRVTRMKTWCPRPG